MSVAKDLTGEKIGLLKVIERKRENNRTYYYCKCDCGNYSWIRSDYLNYKLPNCGCIKEKYLNRGSSIKVGDKYKHLTVKELLYYKKGEPQQYLCKCDCGKEVNVLGYNLTSGNTTSCGCAAFSNLVGVRFGSLTVVKSIDERRHNSVVWECLCDCGSTCYVPTFRLQNGDKKSCGCMKEIEKAQHTKLCVAEKSIKMRSDNKSGVTGVFWNARTSKWVARITFMGKQYHLGYYTDISLAKEIREEAEEHLYSDFLKWYNKNYIDKK